MGRNRTWPIITFGPQPISTRTNSLSMSASSKRRENGVTKKGDKERKAVWTVQPLPRMMNNESWLANRIKGRRRKTRCIFRLEIPSAGIECFSRGTSRRDQTQVEDP